MPRWKHVDRGTVIETVADPGHGWELADSTPDVPEKKAPEADKAPAKKSTRGRKAAGTTSTTKE